MKALYQGQRLVAEMDYLESQGRDAEAKIKYGETSKLKQYGGSNYVDIMDSVEKGRYGEAFQKIGEIAEQVLEE
jgi:hypothetical protein